VALVLTLNRKVHRGRHRLALDPFQRDVIVG